MIQSREELKAYLTQDGLALGKTGTRPLPYDVIWRFERLLRRTEYYKNCAHNPFSKVYGMWLRYRTHSFGQRLGFSIPINVFGPGLSIAHVGTIVVNGNARVGANCRIQECVTIGATNGSSKAPILGNNIFLGSGARVIGDISLADDIAVGANAVVVKSFETPGVTIGGVPAKIISKHGSKENLNPMLFGDSE